MENQKFRRWLEETPKTIPFYENKILQLENEIKKEVEKRNNIKTDNFYKIKKFSFGIDKQNPLEKKLELFIKYILWEILLILKESSTKN